MMDASNNATFLEKNGYTLTFRRDGFVEVLASRGDERFRGCGASDDDAIADVLRAMFPSSIAKAMLNAALTAQPIAAPVVENIPSPVAAEPVVKNVVEPVVAEPVVKTVEPVVVKSVPVVVAPRREIRAPSAEEVARAVAVCDGIVNEIDDALDDLSMLAPELQRLHMLSFICRARAEAEDVPVSAVQQATSRVARRLTELGRVLWPGSVRALQLHVAPREALPRVRGTAAPQTWDEAVRAVDAAIDDCAEAYRRHGLDDDGYADDAHLTPEPRDVAATASEAMRVISSLTESDAEQAAQAAALVRWLRGHISGRQWGEMMGTLRRVAQAFGADGSVVRNYVDATFAPRLPWAEIVSKASPVFERADVTAAQTALRKQLPQPHAPDVDDALAVWLGRAVALFTTSALVELLRPYHASLERIASSVSFDERRSRRRFREVINALFNDGQDVGDDDINDDDDDDDDSEESDVGAAAFDALVAEVTKHTAGRTAMFVSNREDPELAERLEALLRCSLTWVEGTTRRVDAACEKIARNPPDLVLSATGFQMHKVDTMLARAARASGVPFVRVNRGRPVAVVLALAREFGIKSVPPPADGLSDAA